MIITPPRCTTVYSQTIELSGKAWSGAGDVVKVEVSFDNGASWVGTTLTPPPNTYAWQGWNATITLPSIGFWTIYARATDHTGAVQPMLVPSWNPGGYGNNQAMKLDIEVAQQQQEEEEEEGRNAESRGKTGSAAAGRDTPCWL